MYLRITTAHGGDVDRGVDLVKERVLPAMQRQEGFRGLIVAGDRQRQTLLVMVAWDRQADVVASREAADEVRAATVEALGGSLPTVETYEQLVGEVGVRPPAAGDLLHLRSTLSDPARVQENLLFFQQFIPVLNGSDGFRAVQLLIDRRTGKGQLVTSWSGEDALQGWREGTGSRRAALAGEGIELGEEHTLELRFVAPSS